MTKGEKTKDIRIWKIQERNGEKERCTEKGQKQTDREKDRARIRDTLGKNEMKKTFSFQNDPARENLVLWQ